MKTPKSASQPLMKPSLTIAARRAASDDDDSSSNQSPPISPLRLAQLGSSNSSIAGWSSASSQGGRSPIELDADQCNTKEDRASFNTRFAKIHLETYRQNDRLRWNFDFDHNRPLEDAHHHHHQTVPRYQWEPSI